MSVAYELRDQPIRRLARAEYEKLVLSGCFDEERIELLYGMLVPTAPEGPAHSHKMAILTRTFCEGTPPGVWVRVKNPIVAADDSEPEPDLAIVPPGQYEQEHPRHAHLVVELAASSLARDRDVKTGLYAASGFEEYWLVDLVGERVEVYRQPEGGAYASKQTYRSGEVISPARYPGITVAVADLF